MIGYLPSRLEKESSAPLVFLVSKIVLHEASVTTP